MKFFTASFIFVCLVFQMTTQAQEDWRLRKDQNGIKVFSRKPKGVKFDEIKVESEYEGRISQLAAVLYDIGKQYQWVYKTAKSELLKEVSPGDVFFYTEIECPWPFDNRDLVVHMIMTQNASTKVMNIEAKSADKYLPEKRKKVRIKYSRASWIVTPLNNHRFKVEYHLQIDPGEGAPAWLLNLFSTDGPYESFRNLKDRLKLPQYQHARFPTLVDY
ncbi:MAG: START domain-containing protein [Ferruginibacter sp.]